jgi:phage gp16-like protein
MTTRYNLIAQIHIAKKALALDDETYRIALQAATDKSSCSAMNLSELNEALKHFKKLGWKPAQGNKKYSPRSSNKPKYEKDMIDKIRAIWIDMFKEGFIEDGSEQALSTWVKRTTSRINGGIGIDQAEWLRGRENQQLAFKVLESLKQWQKRMQKQTAGRLGDVR